MKVFLIFISFLFLTSSNVIHEDTPLRIDKNGNIIGLPKEFRNAKFDLKKGSLKVNSKEVVLPSCVTYYFDIHEKPILNLYASWYHSKEIMPYYLNFEISEKNKDYGYAILINLETLELIYVEILIKQGNMTYSHKIKLDEDCLTEYKNGIKTLH